MLFLFKKSKRTSTRAFISVHFACVIIFDLFTKMHFIKFLEFDSPNKILAKYTFSYYKKIVHKNCFIIDNMYSIHFISLKNSVHKYEIVTNTRS